MASGYAYVDVGCEVLGRLSGNETGNERQGVRERLTSLCKKTMASNLTATRKIKASCLFLPVKRAFQRASL